MCFPFYKTPVQHICHNLTNTFSISFLEGNAVNVYEAMKNFKMFNVTERPSTCAVVTGGWVIYSLPSYKGARMLHFEGKPSSYRKTIQIQIFAKPKLKYLSCLFEKGIRW